MSLLLNEGKLVKYSVLIFLSLVISMGSASAWNAGQDKTHEHIAAQLYSDLNGKSHNIDLLEFKKGANKPDVIDSKHKERHAYWRSVNYADLNFKKAKSYYQLAITTKDPKLKVYYFKQESFYMGMASHYISDTYAAPHPTQVINHQTFYKYADEVTSLHTLKVPLPAVNLRTYSGLKKFLYFGYTQGRGIALDWNHHQLWKHPKLAKQTAALNLYLAYTATLEVFKQWFGF